MQLRAKELRQISEEEAQKRLKSLKHHPIYFILENIYDTYNVGGLFRLADAIAAERIYLCGQTEIPPNPKVKKASIGTYKIVNWQYCNTAKEAIDDLNSKLEIQSASWRTKQCRMSNVEYKKDSNETIKIIAVEQSEKAVEYTKAEYNLPLALVFGNETSGVLPETLDLVDQIVEIPMWGINKSLNVIVSAAIVSYWVMGKI